MENKLYRYMFAWGHWFKYANLMFIQRHLYVSNVTFLHLAIISNRIYVY